jgi:hypothetical protein
MAGDRSDLGEKLDMPILGIMTLNGFSLKKSRSIP